MSTTLITLHLPIRIYSNANMREHWAVKARRTKDQRAAGFVSLSDVLDFKPCQHDKIEITITRVGKRKLDDDNLAGGCKGLRDGLAEAMGLDDGGPWFTWIYKQEIGPQFGVHVGIEIEGNSSCNCQ